MNEKAIQQSETQAYNNISSRISNLEDIYQNQMLSSIEQYYVSVFVPGILKVIEKTFAFTTIVNALNNCVICS